MIRQMTNLKGWLMSGAVGLAALTLAPADVNGGVRVDVDVNVGRHCPPPAPVYEERVTRVWVPPVYRTVCDRVWVEPVYRTTYDRVWVPPVYKTVCERVWVPDCWESRTVRHWDGCRWVYRTERVLVRPGYYTTTERQVMVQPGRYDEVARQELVQEGRWTMAERQELVTPGRWEDRVERVAGPSWQPQPLPSWQIQVSSQKNYKY